MTTAQTPESYSIDTIERTKKDYLQAQTYHGGSKILAESLRRLVRYNQ